MFSISLNAAVDLKSLSLAAPTGDRTMLQNNIHAHWVGSTLPK